jgi:hypothetical protein
MQAPDIETTADLLMRFVSQVRREAAQYMAPGKDAKDPFRSAYVANLDRLSSADRSELVRIIKQMAGED